MSAPVPEVRYSYEPFYLFNLDSLGDLRLCSVVAEVLTEHGHRAVMTWQQQTVRCAPRMK